MIEYKLKINGMMCGMCENHINDVIRKNFSVKKITSFHKKGETIIISEDELDKVKLKAIIDETGYILENIEINEYVKKGLFGLFK